MKEPRLDTSAGFPAADLPTTLIHRPRFVTSWFGMTLLLGAIALLLAAHLAVSLVDDARIERGLETNRVHLDSLNQGLSKVIGGMESVVGQLRSMHATDSVLNVRQVVNTVAVQAIVAGLKARGIRVTTGIPETLPGP